MILKQMEALPFAPEHCVLVCAIVACMLGVLCTMLSISLYKMRRQRHSERNSLVQSEQGALLSRMVAGVAHDLNSNTGVIVSAFSFLRDQMNEVHKAFEENRLTRAAIEEHFRYEKETAAIVEANLEKIAELVKSFKRLSVDQANEGIQTFNAKEYLEQILVSLNPRIRKTRVAIELVCDPALSLTMWPGAFSQIVTNLIDNALTHAFVPEAEGTISIHLGLKGHMIELSVADNGTGMEEAVRSRVFDPFFTTRSKEGGTGLGLHVVAILARETLKGSASCSSEPGKGSCFTIQFPQQHTVEDEQHE